MATNQTTKVAVPALSSRVDPEVKRVIQALISQFNSVLDGSMPVGKAITSNASSSGLPATVTLSPVTSVSAVGAMNTILISWTDTQSRSIVSGYDVYRSTVDDLGTAIRIGFTTATGYTDSPPNTSTAIEYFYWVRPIGRDVAGTIGPLNSIAGTSATTANDPAYFNELLQGQILSADLPETLKDVFFQTERFAIIDPAQPPKDITSITRSGTTATCTCVAHGFLSGSNRVIAGAEQPEYNGMKLITVVDADTFTFQVGGSPATPATVAPGISSIKVSGSEATVPFIVQGGQVYISSAMIADAAIDNAKIANVTADKILSGTLKAGQSIIVAAGGDITGSNYAELTDGDINFYAYLNGNHQKLKNLLNQVFFTAKDGDTVTVNYFLSKPDIILYPANIKISDAYYYQQDQSMQLGTTSPVETSSGSGIWTFVVSAKLVLTSKISDAGVSWSANKTASIQGFVWEYSSPSSAFTTPNNTSTITITGSLSVDGSTEDGGHTAALQISLDNGNTYETVISFTAVSPPPPPHNFSVDYNVTPGTYTCKYRLAIYGYNSGDSGSVTVSSTRYTLSGGTLSVDGTVNGLAIR